MKTFPLYALGALTLNLGLARCHAQTNETTPTTPATTTPTTPATTTPTTPATTEAAPANSLPATKEEFKARWDAFHDKGDWIGLRQLGRDWEKAHPEDSDALYAQALSSYMLGDLDFTISEYEKLIAMNPEGAGNYNGTLGITRAVRRNYPDLQLQPLEFVRGDAALEQEPWVKKAASLLAAKKYDEIERVAATLQKSKATNVKGISQLSAFFAGLQTGAGDFGALKSRIAAWRAARPQSNLARLAALQMWTTQASAARGSGLASSITPEMSARMDAALEKAGAAFGSLPKTAYDSPLAFETSLAFALLAGAPREVLDSLFAEGVKKFPDHGPLYFSRALHLLPRWYGEPGEWEAMAKKRAAQIGGENGDIFYARVVWFLTQRLDVTYDSKFDYARARRGLEALQKRRPGSVSVASALLNIAYQMKDYPTTKKLMTSPQGNKLDKSFYLWQTPRSQAVFAELRMGILGDAIS